MRIENLDLSENENEPFKCDICESTFTLESALKQHLSIHEKKKPVEENLPYCCKKCPLKFGDVLLAKIHFLKDHQGIESMNDENFNNSFRDGNDNNSVHDGNDKK